eukprot:gnl/Spiro4/12473_TR6585_c0_g1_i2.p1 gnl/Spiro4/12473_TR6585_c0_g1~~gnl/Spiro4/12473_TR6585_c0_g1_i2.p1  ORF type:complete len:434 (+),score=103.06 gnl/Spiro4/12473_TR6585_c0_g1_i2:75-1304(+)
MRVFPALFVCVVLLFVGHATAQTVNGTLTDGVPVIGSVPAGQWLYYSVTFGTNRNVNLVVTATTVNDNLGLVASADSYPTLASYTATSIRASNPWAMVLTPTTLATGGTWIIGVYGANVAPQQTGNTDFTLVINLEFNFMSFSNCSTPANCNLAVQGSAAQSAGFVQLTPALTTNAVGALWYQNPITITNGFDVYFTFRVYGQNVSCPVYCGGGDGFAFVIQPNAGWVATGAAVQGGQGRALGYAVDAGPPAAAGYNDAVAIEFDTWNNRELYDIKTGIVSQFIGATQYVDYRDQHVAVMTNSIPPAAPAPGTPVQADHRYQVGGTPSVPSFPTDGNVHTARIKWFSPYLSVFIDDLRRPVLVTQPAAWIANAMVAGQTYMGFTAATGTEYQVHEIQSWQYCSRIGCTP